MRRGFHIIPIVLLTFFLFAAIGCSTDDSGKDTAGGKGVRETQLLAFNGGPTGGTFNFFANKISSIISSEYDWLDVSARGSGGSAENLRALNSGDADMAIVYSGDAFLGRNGKLPEDRGIYDGVRALSFLYGAPAQLVVHKDSGITSVGDLVGKRVAIGNPGSGAALSAERFFRHLGLWERMDIRHLGYSQAARDFSDKLIDAFWVLVGYPNSAIIEASSYQPIALVDLHDEAVRSGFYDVYPFYSAVSIPEGTYTGLSQSVQTFQDAALWCANESVSSEAVYSALKAIYSSWGLKDMVNAHKAASDMAIDTGIRNVPIPLHPGAVRFWKEQGVNIPPKLLP